MTQTDEKITIRKAVPADAEGIARLYDDVYKGRYPSKDFMDPSIVGRLIETDRIWIIALNESDKVIGSAVGNPNKANNSFEYGNGVVDPEYWHKGVGTEGSKEMMREGVRQGYDFFWGSPRVRAVQILLEHMGFAINGYLLGGHKVKSREIHLISMKYNESGKEKRVVPEFFEENPLYQNKKVQEITDLLGLNNRMKANYPRQIIASAIVDNTPEIKLGYCYREGDRALVITSILGNPAKIEYIELDVLADKIESIKNLLKLNFQITAFLPGWFGRDERYDCVKMSICFEKPELYEANEKFVDTFEELQQNFGQLEKSLISHQP